MDDVDTLRPSLCPSSLSGLLRTPVSLPLLFLGYSPLRFLCSNLVPYPRTVTHSHVTCRECFLKKENPRGDGTVTLVVMAFLAGLWRVG